MAGRRYVDDRPRPVIFKRVDQFADENTRIEGDCLAGLKVDLHTLFVGDSAKQLGQTLHIIARTVDVMAAAHMQPVQSVQLGACPRLQRSPGVGNRLEILLAQRMEVQSRHAAEMFLA